jgi:hypothetical protein
MRCWNCRKKIPDSAKVCKYCEAAVEDGPTKEEMEAVGDLLAGMPPDVLDELREAMEDCDTAEDFADQIFVGDCPKCGSRKTGNCEADPEIDCILAGRCYECGHLWCTECGRVLTSEAPECPCWDEDDDDPLWKEFDDEDSDDDLDDDDLDDDDRKDEAK